MREPQRLAISLRVHHSPVPRHPVLEASPLLMAEEHRGAAVPGTDSADQRRIVGRKAVAVQLDEIGRQAPDVVQRIRPVGVAGKLDDLPDGERRRIGLSAVPGHGYISRRCARILRSSVRDTTMSTWPRASWNSAL